jgi:hypothetical protein
VLPAHAAFDILRSFLFAHLPPPDAQGLKGICSMRRAVMAGFVAPDALLLVPFFAIAAECLEPFTALPGIKPANRKRVSRAALMASSLRCLGATRASIRASRSLSTNRSMCVRDDPTPLPGCRGGRCGSPRCNLPSGLSGLRCPGHSPFRTSAGRQLMSQTDPFGHQTWSPTYMDATCWSKPVPTGNTQPTP